MKRFNYSIVGLFVLLGIASCGGKNGPAIPNLGPIPGLCGLGCPGETVSGVTIKGVADGNSAISGVASVDAFFASAINFESAADNVSAGIEAQLDAIKGDFGIAASANLKTELSAQIKANVEGSVNIDYQPARCAVDATATVQAQARCEGMVTPPMATVECKGACEVDATADVKCDANVDLQCTFTGPTVDCSGSCEGTCEAKVDVAASCSGTCNGTCSGSCSAYSDSGATKCAGTCSGMCMGTCEAKVDASAKCMGTCKGECTVTNPMGGCKGAAHAECKAKASASVMCSGKCEGDFTPPKASAQCEASAKADASVNVQCTPPKLALSYKLKAGVDAMAQARFEGALKTLVSVRLPALLQASARAKFVAQAGEGLAASATAAVKDSVNGALGGNLSIKATFGLGCALKELPKVKTSLSASSERLTKDLMAAGDVNGAVGITG
jgi:hypothetical protein